MEISLNARWLNNASLHTGSAKNHKQPANICFLKCQITLFPG